MDESDQTGGGSDENNGPSSTTTTTGTLEKLDQLVVDPLGTNGPTTTINKINGGQSQPDINMIENEHGPRGHHGASTSPLFTTAGGGLSTSSGGNLNGHGHLHGHGGAIHGHHGGHNSALGGGGGLTEENENDLLSLQICSIISAGSLGGSSVFTYRARQNQTIDSIKSEVLKIIKAHNHGTCVESKSSSKNPPAAATGAAGKSSATNTPLDKNSPKVPPASSASSSKGAAHGHKRGADGKILDSTAGPSDARPRRRDQLFSLLYRDKLLRNGTVSSNGLVDGAKINIVPLIETGLLGENRSVVMVNMCAEEQDQFNNPSTTTTPTFSPSSDTSEYYYHHHQSVLDALEGLNDQQVGDFLGSRAPLNLTMRLGDHVMLIQLQLSKVGGITSSTSKQASASNLQQQSSGGAGGETFFGGASKASITQIDSGSTAQQKGDTTYASLTEASRKLTDTLKKLSSHVVSTSANFLSEDQSKHPSQDTCCTLARKPKLPSAHATPTPAPTSSTATATPQAQNNLASSSSTTNQTTSGQQAPTTSTIPQHSSRTLLRDDLSRHNSNSSNSNSSSTGTSTPCPPTPQTQRPSSSNNNGGGSGERIPSTTYINMNNSRPNSNNSNPRNVGGKRTAGGNSQSHSCPRGIHHHGKGVYSGTFSGTLNPYLQDNTGRPKQHVSTIVHILNDLLSGIITNHQNFVSTTAAAAKSESETSSSSSSSSPNTSSSSSSSTSSSTTKPSAAAQFKNGNLSRNGSLSSSSSPPLPGSTYNTTTSKSSSDSKKRRIDPTTPLNTNDLIENQNLREKIERVKESLRLRRLRLLHHLSAPSQNNTTSSNNSSSIGMVNK